MLCAHDISYVAGFYINMIYNLLLTLHVQFTISHVHTVCTHVVQCYVIDTLLPLHIHMLYNLLLTFRLNMLYNMLHRVCWVFGTQVEHQMNDITPTCLTVNVLKQLRLADNIAYKVSLFNELLVLCCSTLVSV